MPSGDVKPEGHLLEPVESPQPDNDIVDGYHVEIPVVDQTV